MKATSDVNQAKTDDKAKGLEKRETGSACWWDPGIQASSFSMVASSGLVVECCEACTIACAFGEVLN